MVVHADGTGHVEDVALVRGREAWAGGGADRGDRVTQGLSGTGSGKHDRHVLPAGAHGRSVHDVAAERIARLHAFRVVVLDETGRHLLGPFPGDLGHGFAVAHARRVHVDPGAVRASGDLRGDLACQQPPAQAREGSGEDDEQSGQRPLRAGELPLAGEDVQEREDVEPVARRRAYRAEHGHDRQCDEQRDSRRAAGRPDGPSQVGYPVGLEFRIDVHRYPLSRTSASSARIASAMCRLHSPMSGTEDFQPHPQWNSPWSPTLGSRRSSQSPRS